MKLFVLILIPCLPGFNFNPLCLLLLHLCAHSSDEAEGNKLKEALPSLGRMQRTRNAACAANENYC